MAKSTNGCFLNWVNQAIVHENARKDGKGSVMNISIPIAASKSGYGSIVVNPSQLFKATKRTKAADGSVTVSEVEGYYSVLLGAPDKERNVSILTKKGYDTIKMTNADIKSAFEEARKAYREAQKAQAPAEA